MTPTKTGSAPTVDPVHPGDPALTRFDGASLPPRSAYRAPTAIEVQRLIAIARHNRATFIADGLARIGRAILTELGAAASAVVRHLRAGKPANLH